MKKHIIPLLLFVCLLAGCTAEQVAAPDTTATTDTPAPTATISARQFTLPAFVDQSFHPISGASSTNLTLAPLMYESLFTLAPDLTAQPQLCADYTVNETFTQWRFTLVDTVFSDGTPLTAAEVVSSLLLSQSAGNAYSARLTGSKIYASDGAVCIDLPSPRSGLLQLLDIPIVSGNGDRPLGTGPYALVEVGNDLCLSLRPDWRGAASYPLSVIPLQPLAELDDLVAAFDTGNLSLVDTDLTAATALGFSGGYEKVDYPTSQMIYVGFQTSKSICRDSNLRLAIAQAIDRESLCQQSLSRLATATALPVAPHSALYPAAVEPTWTATDAAALLDAAGYLQNEEGLRTQGHNPISLQLLICNENTYILTVAKAIAEDLGELGLSVTLQSLPYTDYLSALSKGEFDLYLGQVRLTADGDLSALVSGSLNYSNYQSADARERLAYYLAAPEQLREGALAALCQTLLEDVPFTVVGFKCRSVLSPWGEMTGLSPTQGNVFYQFSLWEFS